MEAARDMQWSSGKLKKSQISLLTDSEVQRAWNQDRREDDHRPRVSVAALTPGHGLIYYLAEFIRTYQFRTGGFSEEDLDTYARHLASPGGLTSALGIYRAIAAEAPALVQLTNTKLTIPVWAVGGDHSMSTGPFEQFQHLANSVKGVRSKTADIGLWKNNLAGFLKTADNFSGPERGRLSASVVT